MADSPRKLGYDHDDIDQVFSLGRATPEDLAHYQAILAGFAALGHVLVDHVPNCPDRTAIVRQLREAKGMAIDAVRNAGRY